MNVRGPRAKWWPLSVAAVIGLAAAVLYLAPLQGLLVVGLWLICPLLMLGMHRSGHHGPQH